MTGISANDRAAIELVRRADGGEFSPYTVHVVNEGGLFIDLVAKTVPAYSVAHTVSAAVLQALEVVDGTEIMYASSRIIDRQRVQMIVMLEEAASAT